MIGLPAAVRALSPGGSRGRHQTLIFHRVLAARDPLLPGEPDQADFDALVGMLKRHFTILPLAEAIALRATDQLPRASLSITFDDGYADNATRALPVLTAHGVHATFFVATGFLDGGRMWNDTVIETVRRLPEGTLDLSRLGLGTHPLTDAQRPAVLHNVITAIKHLPAAKRAEKVAAISDLAKDLPDDLMMRSDQVKAMVAAGMEIGGHTVTHPILTRIDDNQARQEIADGKAHLEALLDQPIRLFAYPNGKPGQDYAPQHASIVRDLGFEAAVTTAPGVMTSASDPFQLPRFTPWDQTHPRFILRLLMNRYGRLG